MSPDDPFFDRFAPRDIDDEAGNESAQIEATIEAVAERGEAMPGELAVLQGMDGAGQSGQVARLERTDDVWHAHAASVTDGCDAGRTVTEDRRLGRQNLLGPLAERIEHESADQVELQATRGATVIDADCGDERHLVLGAPAGLAGSTLARSPQR